MYDIKIIKRALKLLMQYDYSFIKVSRKLGIKVPTLRKWRNKEINNEPLLLHTRKKSSKWSESFKSEILDYYFQHGENMIKTQRKFGEPSYSMLKIWVKEDKRNIQKHFVKKRHLLSII